VHKIRSLAEYESFSDSDAGNHCIPKSRDSKIANQALVTLYFTKRQPCGYSVT